MQSTLLPPQSTRNATTGAVQYLNMSRQQAFQKLRPPCVDLSSVTLKFRGQQTNIQTVQRSLETLHSILQDLGQNDALDEKLAEYTFYPISLVLNESKRISVRCLELAVRCLRILLEKGWKQRLGPDMGKQLLILLTIFAGGSPAQDIAVKRSEELTIAALKCLESLLHCLAASQHRDLFNNVGSASIIDQAVFVLLGEITGGVSENVQLGALEALQTLLARISNRQTLASLLPRTASSLIITLTPSTQTRRSQKVLMTAFEILTEVLRAVLNDTDTARDAKRQVPSQKHEGDGIVLDASWLKATASQVKLALANVVRLKSHDSQKVCQALAQLCLMVVEKCKNSLADSQIMMVETLVALSTDQGDESQNQAYLALKHLAASDNSIVDILRLSLHDWTIALPRVMQTNDDGAKQRLLKQISTAFEILSQAELSVEILDETLASTLCDSLSAAIRQPNISAASGTATDRLAIMSFKEHDDLKSFQPVLMGNRSQTETLSELRSTVLKLASTGSSVMLTRAMMNRLYTSSGDGLLAVFWLSLNLLKMESSNEIVDEFLDFGPSLTSRPASVEELYSVSLPILLDLPDADPTDWRLPALALESIALQAQHLGTDFRPELIDALYPTLQLMGSSNSLLRSHAMTALNMLSAACGYSSTSDMLISNVDYLVNSIALKLNTFDISPQAPQVLLMMIRLCGATLIPYLDDLVGSIFAALDSFHGYPRLVELLFSVLGTILEEATKPSSTKSITDIESPPPNPHRKLPAKSFTISDLLIELSTMKAPPNLDAEDSAKGNHLFHPKRPFTSTPNAAPIPSSEPSSPPAEDDAAPSQDQGKEPPLPPTSTLLLKILQSIPPHLSSPSPALRTQLLTLLSATLGSPHKLDIISNENHLLPLINTLWPSVSARLHDEEVYVVVGAAGALAGMMKAAGDFMAGRVESELPKWKRLHNRIWKSVKAQRERSMTRALEFRDRQKLKALPAASTTEDSGKKSFLVTTSSKSLSSIAHSTSIASLSPLTPHTTNNPEMQIFNALTSLLTAVLGHVRLQTDLGDEVVEMLVVGDIGGKENEDVREVIGNWNADLLWLILEKDRAKE